MKRVMFGPPKNFKETLEDWNLALSEGHKDFTIVEIRENQGYFAFLWSVPELLKLPEEVLDKKYTYIIKCIEGGQYRNPVWTWRMGEGTIPLRKNFLEKGKYEMYLSEYGASLYWNEEMNFYPGLGSWLSSKDVIQRISEEYGFKLNQIMYGL